MVKALAPEDKKVTLESPVAAGVYPGRRLDLPGPVRSLTGPAPSSSDHVAVGPRSVGTAGRSVYSAA